VADIVIVGAGIGGLGAALTLGRQGCRVIVLERDAAPVPASTEEMWSAWPRPGTPHAPLGHGFGGSFRVLIRERFPDLLQRMEEAGLPSKDWGADRPGAERRPEDDGFIGFLARRAVVEGIMRQAVEREPTVEVRAGCRVVGLLAEPSPLDGVPRVVGVRTADSAEIRGETVIAAGGRTLQIQRWLEQIGAQPAAEESEVCGFRWYTRFFRLLPREGEDSIQAATYVMLSDLRYLIYDVFGADQGTFCLEIAIPNWDHELTGLQHEATFMAVAGALPEAREWTSPERSEPIGPVAPFGGEYNLLRRFTHDGRPLALGLHVIGDARCTTNNIYGWGVKIAFAQGVDLADILIRHPGDALTQAQLFEERWSEELAEICRLSVEIDRARLRDYRGEPKWEPSETGEAFIQTVVTSAASEDPEIFRALRRRSGLLDPVGALARNTALHDRARALAAIRPPQPPTMPAGPTREALLRVIAAVGEGKAVLQTVS
jgi:2-polyprenyl-6-methoxyphenol hydroxylase-like FAD-dependent oxidoreductase